METALGASVPAWGAADGEEGGQEGQTQTEVVSGKPLCIGSVCGGVELEGGVGVGYRWKMKASVRPRTAPNDPLLPGPLRPTDAPQLPQLHGSARRRGSTVIGNKIWVMPRAVAVAPATYYLSPRERGVLDGQSEPPFTGMRATSARGAERPRPHGEDLRAAAPYATHRPSTSGGEGAFTRADANYLSTGLERVRARVQKEVRTLERACRDLPEFSAARLEMHQTLLNRLLSTFRGYAPAFSKIKAEFDRAVAARQAQLVKARAQAVHMQALDCGYDLELPAIKGRYERLMKPDRESLAALRREIAVIDGILEEKTALLKEATVKRKGERETHEELEEQQQVLAIGMRAGEMHLRQIFMGLVDSDSSVWQAMTGIQKCKTKVTCLTDSLQRKRDDLDAKEAECRKLHNDIMDLHVQLQQMTKEVRESTKKLANLLELRAEADQQLKQAKAASVDRTRPKTPRPDWAEAQASLAKVLPLDTATSTSETVQQMVHRVVDIVERTQEAHDDLRRLALDEQHAPDAAEQRKRVMAAADKAGANKKWLICLGCGSSVPDYLRATGKVANKNLPRSFAVKWIEEFWDKKSSSAQSKTMPVDEFLNNYLTLKYGNERGRVEWIYNLMFAIKRYNYDADCQAFLAVLNGVVPEVVYHAQRELLVRLLAVFEKADKDNHGGRLWNTLSRTEFCETVEAEFPLKTEEEKKALQRAIAQDQPPPDVRYRDLFEPVDGIYGKYMETLREQFIQDVQEAYERVESSIRLIAMEEATAQQSIRQMRPEQRYSYLSLIKGAWLFEHAHMSDDEMLALIGKMEIVEVHEGNVIIYEGTPTEHCYIVDEGMAVAMREGEEHPVKTYAVGHVFGDIEILNSDPSRASVVAKASKRGLCRCVRMSAAVFKEVQMHSDDVTLFLHQRTLQVQLELTGAAPAHTSVSRDDNADAQPKKREGYSITVTVAAVRRAFSEHYDKEMPKKEISRLLALGFGHEPERGDEPDDDATVSLQTFMDRLRTTIVPRFSLREELTDRQRREKFLREISASERQGIEEVFNDLDGSGDGSLDIDELEQLLVRIYGMEPTKLQLQHLMHAIDLDGDGEIDMDEFVSAMATVKEVKLAGEIFKWHQLFNRYDADGSGELGQDEVEKMATEMWGDGHSSTLKMKELMVSEADADGDGLVSWPEFRTMMMKISGGFNDVLASTGVTPSEDRDSDSTTPSKVGEMAERALSVDMEQVLPTSQAGGSTGRSLRPGAGSMKMVTSFDAANM